MWFCFKIEQGKTIFLKYLHNMGLWWSAGSEDHMNREARSLQWRFSQTWPSCSSHCEGQKKETHLKQRWIILKVSAYSFLIINIHVVNLAWNPYINFAVYVMANLCAKVRESNVQKKNKKKQSTHLYYFRMSNLKQYKQLMNSLSGNKNMWEEEGGRKNG